MIKTCIVALVAIFMSGCAAHFNAYIRPTPVVVFAQSGQTVKQVVDNLPPTGGVIVLGAGTWIGGYLSGGSISKPNVTIRGSGMPSYNTRFTAMSGGTVVLGPLPATSGADYFTVKDLGVDAGQAYINSNNGGTPTDALEIYNAGQVLHAPPVQSPLIENVSCLGYSTLAAVHCMLVENVNNAYVHNVQTVMNLHGLVLKGTNSKIDGVYARGHGIDSVIVESDAYAPTSHNALLHIRIESLFSAGDTKGIVIIGVGAVTCPPEISPVEM